MLQDESESLEDGAVAEPIGVCDEQLVVPVLAADVFVKHVSDVAHSSPQRWIVQNVNDRPRWIRGLDPCLVAPNGGCAKRLVGGAGCDAERGALDYLFPVAHRFVVTTNTVRKACSVKPQCSHAVQPPM